MPERERPPIETPRPIALASARREYADTQRAAERESRLRGQVYVPHSEEKQEQTIKEIAVRTEKFLQARNNRVVANELNLLRLTYQLMVFDAATAEDLMISERNKQVFDKRIKSRNVELFYEPAIDISTSYLFKEFDEAEALAKERGIPIEQVYQDDELYGKVVRQTYETPQEHAEAIIAPALNKDLREASKQFHHEYEGFRAFIYFTEKGHPKKQAEGKAEHFVQLLESDPNYHEEINAFVHDFRQVHYVAADEEIRKYWGDDAIEGLSPDIKHGISYFVGETMKMQTGANEAQGEV